MRSDDSAAMPHPKPRSPRVVTALLFAAGYLVIMAAGWLADPYDYGTVGNLFYQTPFLILALLYTYWLIRRYHVPVARAGRRRAPGTLWIVIAILLLNAAGMVYPLVNGFNGRWVVIPAVFLATMMVGFAEEGMFRGFLITSFARRMGISAALVLSSAVFGLLHAVNILAHAPLAGVIVQVVFTMFVGYVFATVYLRSGGSIVMVAILHGFYDFFVFCQAYATLRGGATLPLVSVLNLCAWVILAIALLIFSAGGLFRLPGTQSNPRDGPGAARGRD